MIGLIKEWGNSLVTRISRLLTSGSGIEPESSIQIESEDIPLIASPGIIPRYELSDLLEQINVSNLHPEIDTGQSQGVEI